MADPRFPDDDATIDNVEQDDEDAQAQSVADEARGRQAGDAYEDSERGGSADRGAVTPDDAPDLIDQMNQMVSSGHIDMGAFAGEPAHDDEDDRYGDADDDID